MALGIRPVIRTHKPFVTVELKLDAEAWDVFPKLSREPKGGNAKGESIEEQTTKNNPYFCATLSYRHPDHIPPFVQCQMSYLQLRWQAILTRQPEAPPVPLQPYTYTQ